MKIIELKIDSIMKISACFIRPSDSTVVVQGENSQGKSSILDSILFAFKGDRVLPKQPIKSGAKKGEIVIKIDGNSTIPPFTITRTITDKKAYLKIEPVEVLKGETPRSFLDKIIGSISFDPLDFINRDPKKQRSTLLELIGVNVDEIDKREKEAFDKRADKARELKVAESKLVGYVTYPEITETEEISAQDITVKLTKAMEEHQSFKNRTEANNRLRESGVQEKATLELRKEELERLKQEIAGLELSVEAKRKQHRIEKDALAEIILPDLDEIKAEISTIDSKNAKIRANKNYKDLVDQRDLLQIEHVNLDNSVESVRQERIDIISNATMPIPGLSFDEDGLIYNSIPLSQCSDGEKLMVSMAISMALNPTMRVLRIKDGSLLGPTNLKIIKKMVDDKGFQLWLEKVSDFNGYESSGGVGIFIEQGQVTFDNGVEVKPLPEPKEAKKPVENKLPDPTPSQQSDEEW